MLELINSRRSVRKWTDVSVAEEDVKDILECAMNAPSAINEQAWQFVVLEGKILEDFTIINKNTAKGSPVAILVCGDLKAQKAEGYYIQDCAAATQNILLALHAKGLGGVWTAIFPGNLKEIQTLLNLPETIIPFSCVPFGYSETTPPYQSRYDVNKVHFNEW